MSADTGRDRRNNPLVDAVRQVKIVTAERNDVVVDMKEADRARLEILADELRPVFDAVPAEDERFDFAISSGLQPRLWIDATAHVIMGRDRRTYRFVRDTRMGRIVLAESLSIEPVVDRVTLYIAERLHDREMAFAADEIVSYRSGISQRPTDDAAGPKVAMSAAKPARTAEPHADRSGSDDERPPMASHRRAGTTAASPIGLIVLAAFVAISVILVIFRDQII